LHRHLRLGGKLKLDHALKIVKDATDIMKEEENCLDLWAPFVVIGDIHGQYQVSWNE
jgi:serine/threonine-protein phosphatase 2B catalytic subunit